MSAATEPRDVLDFWFPADSARANALWWGKNPELDEEIRARFGDARAQAKAGALDHWAESPEGRLALVLVLDQLSRNLFRGDPETYAADAKAVALTHAGLERGHDQALSPLQRVFLYMPLEHSEALEDQDRCVALMRALAEAVAADPKAGPEADKQFANYVQYAIQHRDIVARFGRFPHRNAILSRESTAEESAFLEQPGSSF